MELSHSLWKAQVHETDKIVLLHGMGGTGALWRPIAALLENDYTVLAPDQRGHGGSRGEGLAYSPLDFGQDVIDTQLKLAFHPAWLVGHSMGVRTACAAAHLKPEWARGLVLVDLGLAGPAGGGLGDGLESFLKILPDRFETREEAREYMFQNCPDRSIAQYLMAVSVRSPQGPVTFPFERAALVATIQAAKDSCVRDWIIELAKNQMPVLCLRGETSPVWTREEYEAERALLRPYPSVVFREIAGTGHGLPFEKRGEFIETVTAFINSAQAKP